jgi:hypothetical protein
MKKIFLFAILFFLIALPILVNAQAPFVRCGNPGQAKCGLQDLFNTIGYIYHFIVWDIATPLAVLFFLIGGIILMVSAGNPGLAGKGKTILWMATIGLVLVFCGYLIVNALLLALTGHGV